MYKVITPPDIRDIPENYGIFRGQLAQLNLGWLNTNQQGKAEGFEDADGNKFYIILIFIKPINTEEYLLQAINLFIRNEIDSDVAAKFVDFVFEERISKESLVKEVIRFACHSVHRDMAVSKFAETYTSYSQKHKVFDYELLTAPSPSTTEIRPLPEGCVIRELELDHAPLIAPHWISSLKVSDDSLHFLLRELRQNISSPRPALGIFQGNTLMAWIQVYYDGSVGSLFVLDDHRRKGLGRHLVRRVVSEIWEKAGTEPLAYVLPENAASKALLSAEGFVPRPAGTMNKTTWYEALFGIEERNYELVKEDLKVEMCSETGIYYIMGPNGIKYSGGRFEHVSVKELADRAADIEVPSVLSTMEVVTGDVADIINKSENNGAVFQVASQFNCLEFINPAIIPEHGVERYAYDHTQGPACSIACGPGTVLRNYFIDMPLTPEHTEPQRGQTAERQLDGFDDITRDLGNDGDRLFKLKNGYLTGTEKQMKTFNTVLEEYKKTHGLKTEPEVFEKLWSKLKIGVHYDLECTARKWGTVLTKTPEHRVTQVFCSAAAIGYSGIVTRSDWVALAGGILDATYDGVFSVAKATASRKLFLTFIGGGVFQNSMSWICDAIYKAAMKHKNAGLKIYLVCYDGPCRNTTMLLDRFNKALKM